MLRPLLLMRTLMGLFSVIRNVFLGIWEWHAAILSLELAAYETPVVRSIPVGAMHLGALYWLTCTGSTTAEAINPTSKDKSRSFVPHMFLISKEMLQCSKKPTTIFSWRVVHLEILLRLHLVQ